MTEKTREHIIVGGVGLGAVVILAVLVGKRPSAPPASASSSAANPVQPLAIPNFAAAQFPASAPINIVSAPVFNAPGTRPTLVPKTVPPATESKCGCECDETPPPFTSKQVARSIRGLGYSSVIQASNQRAQFPPQQFPWLYQH